MPSTRRSFVVSSLFATAGIAAAQPRDTRPATLVVPYPPGGNSDYLARVVAQQITETTGRSIVVDNRPGASGNIGAAHAARARPDGSTIMLAPVSIMSINQFMIRKMPFSPEADFVPLSLATSDVMAIAVNASLPIRTLPDLVRHIKSQPETAYAVSGVGQPMYLAGIQLGQRIGATMTPVVYKGGGPLMTDLVGGSVHLAISGFSSMKSFHDAGKIRILAVGERERFAGAPDIPTVTETFDGFEIPYWAGFWTPAGTPVAIAEQWTRSINEALSASSLKAGLLERGIIVRAQGPRELAAAADHSRRHFGPIIRELGITAES